MTFNRSRLLGLVSMLATLGTGLAEPPPPPREPAPTPEEFDKLVGALRAAGVDVVALLAEIGDDSREFMRRGWMELRARDRADEAKFDMVDRHGSLIQRHADKPRTELTGSIPSVLLREVGDDQGLAEAAIWIARGANTDLRQAALFAVEGGQEFVNLMRSTELRDLSLFNREPAAFDDIPTFRGVPLARRLPDGSLSTTREPYTPRGPGLQIRDARTRAGMSLRDLGVRLGIGHVELGEMERNLRPVGAELWAKARAVLPALPEVMPPETARPRPERQVLNVDAALHPAGRCTCGGGGGGTCEWCRMDQHRAKREERKRGRALLRQPVAEMKGDPELNGMLQEGMLAYDRARKRLTRQAKQARKARRGW